MLERLRAQLKLAGYSVTGPRETVFLALSDRAISMAELQDKLNGKLDRASMYRTLELFERLGIMHILGQGKNRRYELSDRYNTHHHHLNCARCNKIEVIEAPLIEKELARLADKHGFVTASHQLELKGLCRNCASVSLVE